MAELAKGIALNTHLQVLDISDNIFSIVGLSEVVEALTVSKKTRSNKS
jgi:hypothetical protein